MMIESSAKRSKFLLGLVKGIEWVTLTIGTGLLLWPVMVMVESAYAQWTGERQLAQAIRQQSETEGEDTVRQEIVDVSPSARAAPKVPAGSVVGKFEIPRLGLASIVLEGTDDGTLKKSIGHVEGTGSIGGPGNIGIAGHRDTHFRKLKWIRRDDDVIVTAPNGKRFRYLVEWSRVVPPTQGQVLDPEHGPALTLITCFPFEYVGSAPMRMVVRALPDQATRQLLGAKEHRLD